MEEKRDMEQLLFSLITAAGEAKSYAVEALREAKEHHKDRVGELLGLSKKSFKEAHGIQTDLLTDERNGKPTEFSLLLIHAQDQLMTTMLAMELIDELIDLYERQGDKQ